MIIPILLTWDMVEGMLISPPPFMEGSYSPGEEEIRPPGSALYKPPASWKPVIHINMISFPRAYKLHTEENPEHHNVCSYA